MSGATLNEGIGRGGVRGEGVTGERAPTVWLRPVRGEDVARLRELEDPLRPDASVGWRGTRIQEPPEVYQRTLWAGVLEQNVVVGCGRDLGLVVAYNWSPRHRVASFAMTSFGGREPLLMVGAGLFLVRMFDNWGLRKVRIETDTEALEQFRGATRFGFEERCRLPGAVYRSGTALDRVVLELDAERVGAQLRSRVRRRTGMSS